MTDAAARNQLAAVDDMFAALIKARALAHQGLLEAQEAVDSFKAVLDAIPEGIGPETHDLKAVRAILDVGLEATEPVIVTRFIKDCLDKMGNELSEANEQREYLVAGDFAV